MSNNNKNRAYRFLFQKNRLLLVKEGTRHYVPRLSESCFPATIQWLPLSSVPDDEEFGFVAEVDECFEPLEGMEFVGLRNSYDTLPLEEYRAAGKASQILYWDKNSRYCPACGSKTEQKTPICKRCTHCGKEQYPVISPAIIVLIQKEDQIFLVRAKNFVSSFHGLVAGFLEVGETLEECVVREVREETGMEIKNLRYWGNQSWPYPSGLMLGFVAEYASGTIKLQDEELLSGAFYSKENLPEIPKKLSLARKLIDWWLAQS